jgi:hypothetical protein
LLVPPFFFNFKETSMSDTTYASRVFRLQSSPLLDLLCEMYAATPLAIFLAALREARSN